MTKVFHVAKTGSDGASGSEADPLLTIGQAASLAMPGDTVMVHEGEYREWVKPPRGGLSDKRRIVYCAAPGESVVIKGSEIIRKWEKVADQVWKATVSNQLFGEFNPYREVVGGDWLIRDEGDYPRHLGEVYLNGKSFFEAPDVSTVLDPPRRETVTDQWTGRTLVVQDPDRTQRVWFAQVDEVNTVIWANFAAADPNEELVEINVRRSVFFPDQHRCDYITVRGFEMAHAATPWAPPTADQPGLVGPNWARGWLIEDNVIHDAKCSAVSLGKEMSTGHNQSTAFGDKPGYQYQLETVFQAQRMGWNRESVGSHVVRGNTIFECGQNAIVGHLGAIFSEVRDNDISEIGTKHEFYGHEIAGIKLHAAIDVLIEGNHIHECTLGTWLDWQTQGTRVTRNVYHDNVRDLFIEVSHGPYLVDHNILASAVSLESLSQGGAYLNNLFGGVLRVEPVMERATPYHAPHSTEIAGVGVVYAGDDRFIGNIFVGDADRPSYVEGCEGEPRPAHGTSLYDQYPPSFDQYLRNVAASPGGDHGRFLNVKQPVYISRNAYWGSARAYQHESDPQVWEGFDAGVAVTSGPDGVFLEISTPEDFHRAEGQCTDIRELGWVRMAGLDFEVVNDSLVRDLLGVEKTSCRSYSAGPIASLTAGRSSTQVIHKQTPPASLATAGREGSV